MEIFEGIYNWFVPLFGENMAEHLKGWDGIEGDYTKANLYVLYGGVALVSAFLFCILYYYVFNHPRWNRWLHWVGVLTVFGMVNFVFGWVYTLSDLSTHNISEDIVSGISLIAFPLVGVVNFILSAVFFTIFSFIIKWGSRNCKHSPCL
jgi:hypothetical protein